jgi:hypothetical protein
MQICYLFERYWFQNAANNKENWFGLQNKKISPPKKTKNHHPLLAATRQENSERVLASEE